MPPYRYQVTFEATTGMPEDRVVNVLYANHTDDAEAMAWAANLSNAYGTLLPGQTDGITAYYGESISRVAGAHEITVYDLADPEPRAPIGTQPFGALTENVGDNLPREVAFCLSFQGDQVSGGNQARRRGRIYLGPFNTSVLGGPGGGEEARPLGAFIDDVIIFAERLLTMDPNAWGVKSTFSPVLIPVTNGWVDNAFDTQRRRGLAPNARTTFGA